MVAFYVDSYGQIPRIGGELRYDYHYQDFLYDDNLTTIKVGNPVVDLRLMGNLLSPRIIGYSFFTSLNANFVSTNSPFFSYSSDQYTWNKYNLILNLLPYSPVKVTVAARENSYELKSNSDYAQGQNSDRSQEQRIELSANQVPWLPTFNVSLIRNRAFSVEGYPYDVVNHTLSFTATGATDTTGSYGLTGTMADFRDKSSGAYDRFLTLQFSGSREISAKQGLNVNAEYEQYTGYSVMDASAMYRAMVTNSLRSVSVLAGGVAQSTYSQTQTFSFSQSALYTINEYLQSGLGVSGIIGNGQANFSGGARRDRTGSLGTYGNLQHRRMLGRWTMLNAIAAGYNQQQYSARYNNTNVDFTTAIGRPFGQFTANANYIFSLIRIRNAVSYDVIENNANFVFSGRLSNGIQSQTDLRFRDSRYPGYSASNRDQQMLLFTQRFNGSFVLLIPFHLGLSGSANWYFTLLKGRTYAWSFSFASPAFFIRNLSADYVYSRSYDPYYQRELAEHYGSLSYQYNALVVSTRFRYSSYPVRVRELNFTASRFF